MSKATYKGKSYGHRYDKGATYLYYEYRWHEYIVEDSQHIATVTRPFDSSSAQRLVLLYQN